MYIPGIPTCFLSLVYISGLSAGWLMLAEKTQEQFLYAFSVRDFNLFMDFVLLTYGKYIGKILLLFF